MSGGAGLADAVGSVSLFELPVSRGARTLKLALVLLLDAILAGAGIVMIWSYVAAQRKPPPPVHTARPPRAVEVLAPKTVTVPAVATAPVAVPLARSARAPAAKRKPATGPAKAAAELPKSGAGSGAGPGPGAALSDAGASAASDSDPDIAAIAAQLRLVVDSHQAQLERCYQRAAKTAGPGDPLTGRIAVRFTLMPDGTAANVHPTSNTTGSARLADCVAGLLGTWALPAGGSAPIELEWPFLFRPPVQP